MLVIMEYTNDVILGIHYKDDRTKSVTYGKCRRLKKIIGKVEGDSFLTISIVVSTVVLCLDYLLVKEFVEIINLL